MAKRIIEEENIVIGGTDVSSWCESYELVARVGEVAKVNVTLHYDPEIIRIKSNAFHLEDPA